MILRRSLRTVILVALGVVMIVPLYILVTNAFKSQQDILQNPFTWPASGFTLTYLLRAITSPDFNVIQAYAITITFVIAVNVLSIIICGPAAYVIARRTSRIFRIILLFVLAGLFIPGQVIVIPVIYVLRFLGLMNTVVGFLVFETTLTVPITMFLFVAFIQSLPRELDEAARIDGCGRFGTFWRVIFPLMRPVVATTIILNTIGVWSDFVNPQIILGPGSGLYTVTTGIYAAVSKYSTDFTIVYPNLLLAVVPVLVFFVIMQKQIAGGLTAGSVKG
jgi:raffinose/stachyose/melibiose transport system permease protein